MNKIILSLLVLNMFYFNVTAKSCKRFERSPSPRAGDVRGPHAAGVPPSVRQQRRVRIQRERANRNQIGLTRHRLDFDAEPAVHPEIGRLILRARTMGIIQNLLLNQQPQPMPVAVGEAPSAEQPAVQQTPLAADDLRHVLNASRLVGR